MNHLRHLLFEHVKGTPGIDYEHVTKIFDFNLMKQSTTHQDIFKTLKKRCPSMLNYYLNGGDVRLFRGSSNYSDFIFGLGISPVDRKSLSMNSYVNKHIDEILAKNHAIALRANSVFCTTRVSTATIYGDVVRVIIPTDNDSNFTFMGPGDMWTTINTHVNMNVSHKRIETIFPNFNKYYPVGQLNVPSYFFDNKIHMINLYNSLLENKPEVLVKNNISDEEDFFSFITEIDEVRFFRMVQFLIYGSGKELPTKLSKVYANDSEVYVAGDYYIVTLETLEDIVDEYKDGKYEN